MKLWDYHTHCYLCNHAIGSIEDYVRSAIEYRISEIGISDHFPMELLPEHFHIYAMKLDAFPSYIDEIKRLRKKYSSQINIKVASEVDFFPKAFEEYKQIVSLFSDSLDFIIGSIHAVPWPGLGAIPIDEKQAIPIIKEIGVDKAYLEYYNSVLRMVQTKFFDIIGHLDLPKKYGLLPENNDGIWEKVLQILDEVEKNGMAVEINTSGYRRQIYQPFPSEQIILELIQRKVPLALGSDAHAPQDIGFKFQEIIKKLKKWGLTSLCQFSNQEISLLPFD
ncbi:MAG: histidinol-phosphatase HisJ [Candidatus Hermodarchaeota archaeon]